MYTRFGEVKFEFPATAAVRSEHQGPHFLVAIIFQYWPSCVIILAFLALAETENRQSDFAEIRPKPNFG